MSFKRKAAPPVKSPKNQWCLDVSWMSGDADHYDTVTYSFKTEAELETVHALFTKILAFKEDYHNTFCDILNHDTREDLLEDTNPKTDKVFIKVVNEFFGPHNTFSELLEAHHISPEWDVTNEGYMACPNSIEAIYHFDDTGKKFLLTPDS